jgi:hypothetical protein
MPDVRGSSIGPASFPHKLGKMPARPGAIKFSLASYVNLEVPKPPAHFRFGTPPKWGDYGNSSWGCCVFAGAANETSLWESEGRMATPTFDEETVLADYAAVTGFNRNDKNTDQGTNMPDAARYRRTVGIIDTKGNRHTIDGYAALHLKNIPHLKAAMWVLGGVGLGFMFPKHAMDQFEARKPWDLKYRGLQAWLNSPSEISGGHYVPAIGIAPNGNIICISWGREQEMTTDFYLKYADEVTCYIDLSRLFERVSPEGFAENKLRNDLASVAQGRVYARNEDNTDVA